MAQTVQSRKPRWYVIPLRVLLVTFILTLLSFAVCLFVAILGALVAAKLHGIAPDLRVAYRHIALPMAIVAGTVVGVVTTVLEIRHYRQTNALQGILRASRG
jgi:hypothetical protein